MTIKDKYYQEKNQLFIKTDLGNQIMVQIYSHEINGEYDVLCWNKLVTFIGGALPPQAYS